MEGFRTGKDTEQSLCVLCWRCMIICDDWWHFLYNFGATNPISHPCVSYARQIANLWKLWDTQNYFLIFQSYHGHDFEHVWCFCRVCISQSRLERTFGPLTRFSFRAYHTHGLGVKISASGRSETLKKSQTHQSYQEYDFGQVYNVISICRAHISTKTAGRWFLTISWHLLLPYG